MTSSTNHPSAAAGSSIIARGVLSSPVLPFLILRCLGVLAAAFACYLWWQEHTAETLLAGPANGAEQVYHSQGYGVLPLLRIAAEVEETRAPGRYLAAVHKWTEALNPTARANDAPWVVALKGQERAEVLAWLAGHKITPSDIAQMETKLKKISPQLSDRETLILEQLTSFSGMQTLGDLHEKTVQQIFTKLYEMGATDTGLREVGLKNWQKNS